MGIPRRDFVDVSQSVETLQRAAASISHWRRVVSMTVPAAEIKRIKPTMTMVGGRVVFEAGR